MQAGEVVSGATGPEDGVVPADDDSGLESEGTDDERERLTEAVRVVKGYKRDWKNAELQLAPAEKHMVRKVRILDAEGLALGTVIATSRRRTRDLINNSFNRFVNGGEEDLPAWFAADERKNWRKPLEVERAVVSSYSNKWKEVNTRSIKKVAEAKARKKKQLVKRMEKARKKAEVVSDTVDVSEKEKVAQIKSIYKKAGVAKKRREVTYVVAKKGLGGQSGRPGGVKGHYRMVDRRLKKDMRAKMSKRKGKGPAKSQEKGRTGYRKNRTKR
uniref:pre-rRNA 2'-O-ribose RNA methyltransferase FTSJ3-like n=1 Tax=Myxine glutinosa TaxID=7769 RepID=UPI00358F16AD